jgi:hypothetical protein
MPEPRAFEDEMAIEKLKRHKSPGTDQIPSETTKARGMTIHSEIHIQYLLMLVRIRKNCEWKELILVPV